jgi:hypothetical protein
MLIAHEIEPVHPHYLKLWGAMEGLSETQTQLDPEMNALTIDDH